jgi:type II secretory pathway pseudopilin PulG
MNHRPVAPPPPATAGQPRRPVRRRAFTIPEVLVAIGLGSLVLSALALVTIYSARSFVGIGNYMDLDRMSRQALDTITRDIRQTRALTSYATNQLTFTDFDDSVLSFVWNPATRRLTRTKNGVTRVLLVNCDYLRFNICQRNPIPGQFNFYPATNTAGAYDPSLCKLVDVSWRCSRTMLGRTLHTESVQTAKIVMRN